MKNSNAVMEGLLKKLDNDEDVEEIGGKFEPEGQTTAAFNVYDQFEQKYDVALPQAPMEEDEEPQVIEQESLSSKRKPNEVSSLVEGDDLKENNGISSINTDNQDNFHQDVHMEANDEEDNAPPKAIMTENGKRPDLPIDGKGNLNIYWYDAHEDYNNQNEIYLFGKLYSDVSKQYHSVSVVVRGIDRIMYAVPREGFEMSDVINEFKKLFSTRFSRIKKWRSRPSKKSYAFEMPVKKGESEFLEIRYSSEYQALPHGLTGITFEHVFGKSTSVLELFLVNNAKLMGPSWITVSKFNLVENNSNKKTWCDYELVIENPKHIECTVEDKNKKPPQLKVLSLAMKTFKNDKKMKEIAMISCLFNDRVECEKQTSYPEKNNKVFTCMRKLNGLPFPYKFVDDIK
jgi:hypothetical protein